MTNQEILEKAIQKAIDGGWKSISIGEYLEVDFDSITGEPWAFWVYKDLYSAWSIFGIIYSHDFAKALWGDLPKRSADMYNCPQDEIGQVDTDNWEHHLQQMVISDDPIKYLGDNI
jgi:hypothetical protein